MNSKTDNKGMNIDGYFSSPIFYQLTQSPQLCESLKTLILNRETEEYRIQNAPQSAHPSLFESRFDFLNWKDESVQQLKQLMLKHLLGFIQQVNQLTNEELTKIRFNHESWFHVANDGAYFQGHTHPNHSWSMVFCVHPGDEQVENEHEAGKIVIMDPRLNAAMYQDPANNNMKREFSFNGFKRRFEKGGLLIFPSYLQHSVEPYRGKESRITVAANFRFFYP